MKTSVNQQVENNQVKNFVIDILTTILGTLLLAISIFSFTVPNHIAPGGITGIATIINYVTKLPIGAITLTINIPIIVIGFICLGKRFMLKTLVSLITFTVFLDYCLPWLSSAVGTELIYTGDKLLASICGGALMGVSLGIVFSRGASTGGMDIINKIIGRRLPHIKLGKIIFMTDLIIVSTSAIVFKSIETALYALIFLYISSMSMDAVLYGFNVCKFIYIISDNAEAISKRILVEMDRGATMFESYGAYTGKKRPTVMVAIRQNEYYKLKKIIESTDPNAFLIVTSANEIVGSGFKNHE